MKNNLSLIIRLEKSSLIEEEVDIPFKKIRKRHIKYLVIKNPSFKYDDKNRLIEIIGSNGNIKCKGNTSYIISNIKTIMEANEMNENPYAIFTSFINSDDIIYINGCINNDKEDLIVDHIIDGFSDAYDSIGVVTRPFRTLHHVIDLSERAVTAYKTFFLLGLKMRDGFEDRFIYDFHYSESDKKPKSIEEIERGY